MRQYNYHSAVEEIYLDKSVQVLLEGNVLLSLINNVLNKPLSSNWLGLRVCFTDVFSATHAHLSHLELTEPVTM